MLQNPIKIIYTFAWGAVSCLQDTREETELAWTFLICGEKLKLLKALPDKLDSCHPVDIVSDVKSLWKLPMLRYCQLHIDN